MKSARLEAFSDGVLAIIITIMVLELKVPLDTTVEALLPVVPVFISYFVSFVFIGIYWNNHHHLFQLTENVNGKILWANLHLLFWISLIPFTTAWIGENHMESIPVAAYGFVILMCAIGFLILTKSIVKHEGAENSKLYKAIGNYRKEKLSLALYFIGIILAFVNPYVAIFCYVTVAFLWFMPDKRIERNM